MALLRRPVANGSRETSDSRRDLALLTSNFSEIFKTFKIKTGLSENSKSLLEKSSNKLEATFAKFKMF